MLHATVTPAEDTTTEAERQLAINLASIAQKTLDTIPETGTTRRRPSTRLLSVLLRAAADAAEHVTEDELSGVLIGIRNAYCDDTEGGLEHAATASTLLEAIAEGIRRDAEQAAQEQEDHYRSESLSSVFV